MFFEQRNRLEPQHHPFGDTGMTTAPEGRADFGKGRGLFYPAIAGASSTGWRRATFC